jgi:hypothetical protein
MKPTRPAQRSWRRWDNPNTPRYDVLDPRGVIRHKWVGALGKLAIDTALEQLLREVEANGRKSPSCYPRGRK